MLKCVYSFFVRVSKTDSGNKFYDSSSGRSAARPKKEDKVSRLNIECGDDGAKYMSYIKVFVHLICHIYFYICY